MDGGSVERLVRGVVGWVEREREREKEKGREGEKARL